MDQYHSEALAFINAFQDVNVEDSADASRPNRELALAFASKMDAAMAQDLYHLALAITKLAR